MDKPDRLYATLEQKENAIADEVTAAHATGRPVLVGTLDIAESERLAHRLSSARLSCVVLNAKNDAEEAAIVAEAGAAGAVTVSTQMAGRGTDIRLGGSAGNRDQIAGLGGLYVIGTGRHASSRLDNQLRGRAGRQGDPGASVFFVSMQDELITSFAPDAAIPYAGDADAGDADASVRDTAARDAAAGDAAVQDAAARREVAADGRVSDAKAQWTVGHAQRAAEGANLEIHRNTWRYNKLIEDQRRIVLEHRDRMLRTDAALRALGARCPERYRDLAATIDAGVLTEAARQIVLYHLDRGWAHHLAVLAGIREGIHLRALGHGPNPFIMALDPLSEFHAEAVSLFTRLLDQVEQRSAETFQTAAITSEGADLDAAGLKRPTATWTYVVQDNPFGTDLDRALRGLRRMVHGTRR